MTHRTITLWTLLVTLLFLPGNSVAQDSGTDIVLTLDEAVQIALIQNLALENARLDIENGRDKLEKDGPNCFLSSTSMRTTTGISDRQIRLLVLRQADFSSRWASSIG